jgi:hypothetical protein
LNAPSQGGALPAGWWKRVRHDLRSAIAPMRMAVQLLRSGRVDAGEREEALQVLDRQLEALLATVEDVGDLMHAQGGGLVLQPAPQDANLLLDIVCGRGALVRELAARNLTLRCDPCESEAAVPHDPARLAALLEFLLLRMAAHAQPGSELVLGLRQDGAVTLHLAGAGASLAHDPELLFLQDIDAGNGEPTLRSLLMREVLRACGLELTPDGEGAMQLRFSPAPIG